MKWSWKREAKEAQALTEKPETASKVSEDGLDGPDKAEFGQWDGFSGAPASASVEEPVEEGSSAYDELDLLLSGPEEPEEEESQEEILARRQRTYSAVAYFGPLGAAIALVYGAKNRLVRFHGLQSMALWVLVLAALFLAGGTNLFVLMTSLVTPGEQLLLGTAIYLVFMVIFVALTYCVLGAITEVPSCLPLIGAPLLALSGLEQEDVSIEEEIGAEPDLDVPYYVGEKESPLKKSGVAAFFGRFYRKSEPAADPEGSMAPVSQENADERAPEAIHEAKQLLESGGDSPGETVLEGDQDPKDGSVECGADAVWEEEEASSALQGPEKDGLEAPAGEGLEEPGASFVEEEASEKPADQ